MVGEKFCVAYFDCSGQVITTYAYGEHHTFVRLIAGLMFGSDTLLGYDCNGYGTIHYPLHLSRIIYILLLPSSETGHYMYTCIYSAAMIIAVCG